MFGQSDVRPSDIWLTFKLSTNFCESWVVMPKFSRESSQNLSTCHVDLQEIFSEVIKSFDCKIVCGWRGPTEQGAAFAEGASKLKWPLSKHNHQEKNDAGELVPMSLAVDAYPFPINFQDIHRFYYFAGFVVGVADQLRSYGLISRGVRWGGDWNSDTEVKDNKFNDLCHFELIED